MDGFARKGDFWSGLALAALGCYILNEARHWTYMGEDGPGAGFFPMWYGGAMVVLSLLLVAGAVIKANPPTAARDGSKWRDLRRALTCWLALAACIVLLKVVGFIPAFTLLAWFMVAVMFKQPQRVALPLALGGALGFYAIFAWALDLSLPSGMLF